jgi:hypothetical protein
MVAEDALRIFVTPALNIKPGDKVLITFGGGTPEKWGDVMDQLRERFPGVEFTALFGVEQVVVQPAEHDAGDALWPECQAGRHSECGGGFIGPDDDKAPSKPDDCGCQCHEWNR